MGLLSRDALFQSRGKDEHERRADRGLSDRQQWIVHSLACDHRALLHNEFDPNEAGRDVSNVASSIRGRHQQMLIEDPGKIEEMTRSNPSASRDENRTASDHSRRWAVSSVRAMVSHQAKTTELENIRH
jgi:hypothetical protein